MASLNGDEGQPRIYDARGLTQWLDARPPDRRRQTAVAVSVRAALRVLPMIERDASKYSAQALYRYALSIFWSTASARIIAKYPTRADEFRAADEAVGYAHTTNISNTAYSAAERVSKHRHLRGRRRIFEIRWLRRR
jgi:hypothetical protein